MKSIDQRMTLLLARTKEVQKKQENRWIALLALFCVVLCVCLFGFLERLTGRPQSTVPQLYGATLLYDNAGGYVLVGVLSFIAAVSITLLCLYRKNKAKKNGGKNAWENENE